MWVDGSECVVLMGLATTEGDVVSKGNIARTHRGVPEPAIRHLSVMDVGRLPVADLPSCRGRAANNSGHLGSRVAAIPHSLLAIATVLTPSIRVLAMYVLHVSSAADINILP